MNGTRVTVAGAGVLGLATALALAEAGCRVTVRDPGGSNASAVAAGMIAPAFEAALDAAATPHAALLSAARALWPEFAARAGITLDEGGALAVGREAWLDDLAAAFTRLGQPFEDLDGVAARGLAPGLSETFPRALRAAADARVDAPAALAALRSALADRGVAFEPGQLLGRDDSDVLVIATGASHDLAALAPELACLSPIKGHIVRVAAPMGGLTVRSEGIYAAPGAAMAFGATMEPGRADVEIDPVQADALLTKGLTLFPELAGLPRKVSAGVRAATPDGLPLAGWSAGEGVALAVGPRRNGWLLAPLVAKVTAACVLGEDPGPYAAALAPGRFGEAG